MIDKHLCTDFVGMDAIKPIAFNPWKHHRAFVCNQITKIREYGNLDLRETLCCIGGTLLDFYMGELSPELIAHEILLQLRRGEIDNIPVFKDWLGKTQNSYRTLFLSDGSRWVLRLGNRSDYFIHIHPGRYSSLTIRCRPTGLKVAIAFRFLYGFNEQNVDVEMVNRAREFVGLCPIKSLNSVQAFMSFLHVLKVK